MNIRIALCEDEKPIRGQLARLIKKQHPQCDLIQFESGEALTTCPEPFDIVLLDVSMKGMDGIETARLLRAKTPYVNPDAAQIIFITGYPDFMHQAFDVNAFHYLLKPLDEDQFLAVLSRAVKQVEQGAPRRQRKLNVRTLDKEQMQIVVNHIKYIESDDKLLIIHTVDGVVQTHGQISRMEKTLGENFFRCHRSFLVNLEMVSGFTADTVNLLGGGQVLLAKKNHRALAEAVTRQASVG